MIINDFFYVRNIVFFIKINELSGSEIIINSIILRGNNSTSLIGVHQEEFWLLQQRNRKHRQLFQSFIDKIKFNNSICLGKNKVLKVFATFGSLEMELHRYLVELWIVLDDHSLEKFELVMVIGVLVSYSSKNEKLIWFLLVHYQVLAADDRYVILVV